MAKSCISNAEMMIIIGTSLYGISVVLARAAMSAGVGPFTFNFMQHLVGAVLLLMVREPLKQKTHGDSVIDDCEINGQVLEPAFYMHSKWFGSARILKYKHTELIVLGALCAVLNFIASSMNQLGLVTVEAGKSAFLTSTYVIFTPLIQFAASRDRSSITAVTWISAVVSLFGSYLLAGESHDSPRESSSLPSFGELVTVGGAVFWAAGIILIDYSVERVDPIDLTCVEICLSTLLCLLLALWFEPHGFTDLCNTDPQIVGIVLIVANGGIEAAAYLLDTVGQVGVSGSRAALLMSMDAVVAVLGGFLALHEVLTLRQGAGCALLLLSTCLASAAATDVEKSAHSTSPPSSPGSSSFYFPYNPILALRDGSESESGAEEVRPP